MTSNITRLVLSAGFTLALGSAFMPLGCGGTLETIDTPINPTPDPRELPASVVASLTACANQGVARLKGKSYAIIFAAKATEDGHVGSVDVKDSMLGDRTIESCMASALEGMSVPMSAMSLRSSRPVAEDVTAPESRAVVGNPLVLAGGTVTLGPIVLIAAGITIVVAVTVYVVSEATTSSPTDVETEKERCRKVKDACIEQCDPELGKPSHGNPFSKCMKDCREAAGCWKATN